MNGIKIKEKSTMGEVYLDGEVIIRQGDAGGCMYVIQEGQVEVVLLDRKGDFL